MLQVLRVAAHKQQHVLQRVAACCTVLQRVAACCSVLHRVAALQCCNLSQREGALSRHSVLRCVAGVAGARAQTATAVAARVVCAHFALRRAA